MVKEISSAAEFDAELTAARSKLVVVDFHAVWCGPCKAIAPIFQRLASQYTNTVFLKVDVDRVQPVAQRYGVRAMPTFLFLKNKSLVDTLQGADPSRLTALVKQHSSGASSSAFSGSGQTLSGTSSGSSNTSRAPSLAGITQGHTSLLATVELKRCSALNEKPDRRLQDIISSPSGGKWLESDADEQLLIYITFKGQVKLSGILLRTLPSHFAHAPKQVKIFANRPGLSFDDATSDPADQQAELTEEHVRGGENGGGGKVFALRFVKFQKVDSLSIAVLSNQRDAETTRIDAIDVFGIADQTTDMSELQKIEGGGATRDMHFSKVSRTGLKGGSLSSSSRGGFTAQTSSSTPSSSTPNTSTDAQQAGRHSRPHSTSSMNPAMPRYRRSGSSSCAPRMQHLDEEDQDEYVDDVSRRPSAQQQSGFAAHAPPSLTEEEEKEFQVAQNASRDAFRGWHYAPLGVALAPPLGALVGGHSDAWSDAILLILASFWLYQFLRVPWEIYYASMTRHVLTHDADEQEQAEESEDADRDTSRGAKKKLVESHQHIKARQAASAELRRSELLSLIFCVTSPIVGAYMLHWMRETMTDGNKYLNTFNIRLFTMAAGIKPWSHTIHLIQRRMLHLQEQVHYPSSKVEKMSQRLRRIEADLSSLRKLYATKNDIRVLREHEAQLGRAVRRSERKEEYLRLSAEEKFSIVEGRLEDLLHEVAINAELIEQERKERERAASLRISLFEAVKYLLGSGLTVRRASPKHYLHDLPRSLPSTAALGIGSTSADADAHLDGAMNGSASLPPSGQTFSPNGPPRPVAGPGSIHSTSANREGSPPSNNGAGSYSSGSSAGDAPQPQRSNSAAGAPRSRSRGAIHHVSDPWWERGVAFYLFLPLNVSSAAIRFAGEKVKHILQDSGNEVARNQRKMLQYQKHLADEQLQQQQHHHHRKQQH